MQEGITIKQELTVEIAKGLAPIIASESEEDAIVAFTILENCIITEPLFVLCLYAYSDIGANPEGLFRIKGWMKYSPKCWNIIQSEGHGYSKLGFGYIYEQFKHRKITGEKLQFLFFLMEENIK